MLKGLLLAPEPDGLSGAGVGRGGGRLGSCGGHCERNVSERCVNVCRTRVILFRIFDSELLFKSRLVS